MYRQKAQKQENWAFGPFSFHYNPMFRHCLRKSLPKRVPIDIWLVTGQKILGLDHRI